jgi:membrane protein implicated in regulation of membrane protease activity
LSPLPASAIGFAGGLVFGGAVYVFARFLYGQQASSELRSSDLVGQSARVVVTIPSGGVGQIRCRLGEELIDKVARAGDNGTIPENALVKIEEVLGEVVIVRKN